MTFRNHTPALLILATLTACQPAPAHADVLLNPASLPLDPARPGWRPSISRPGVPAGGTPDASRGGIPDGAARDSSPPFFSPYGLWSGQEMGPGQVPQTMAPSVVTCRPLPTAVPGPLPLLGVAAAFSYSRKLRNRFK